MTKKRTHSTIGIVSGLFFGPLFALPKSLIFPDLELTIWLGFALIIDLITGLAKAIKNKTPRTSNGFQQTTVKFLRYGGAIVISFILQNVVIAKGSADPAIASFLGETLIVFLVYIEVLSILENLIALNSKDPLSKFVFVPLHNLLSLRVKKIFERQEISDKPTSN